MLNELLFYRFKIDNGKLPKKLDKFFVSLSQYKGFNDTKMVKKRWTIYCF